jgi:hypothetical protein
MVSFDDYRQMFETVWTDRARSAGWKLDFTYRNESCQMVFTR